MQGALRGPFSGALIQRLERLFDQGTAIGASEGELLERFLRAGDELAFEALIARHGPMVLGVCRRLLRDPNDVDDAFQATFLVLVRKAGTLRHRDLLGNWLYGVAHKVAARSRAVSARRTARSPHGHDAVNRLVAGEGGPSAPGGEPIPWIHEEVRRLPEKYRSLVLLCYFEGLTHEQAAERLGCPIGTVKGRLSRAREILRKRLVRRGVTITSAAIGSQLAEAPLSAAVPESLIAATVQAARAAAACSASSLVAGAGVSLPVAALTDGALHAMVITQFKAVAIPLLIAGVVTTGAVIGAAAQQAGSGGSAAASSGGGQPPKVSTTNVSTAASAGAADSQEARRLLAVADLLEGTQQLYDQLAGDDRLLNSRDLPKLKGLSERILMASCELGPIHGSRIAEYTAHLDRMKALADRMEKIARENDQAAPDGTTASSQAKLAADYLAEAEKLLEGQKTKGSAGPSGSAIAGGTAGGKLENQNGASAGGSSSSNTAKSKAANPGKGATATAKTSTATAGMVEAQGRMNGMGGGMGGFGGRGYGPSEAEFHDRVEIAQLAAVLAANGTNPRDQAILKRLDEPLTRAFARPTPLEDVLKQLRSTLEDGPGTTIPIYVDPKGLDQARATLQSPVTMDIQGMPLRTALRLMLRQIGMAYCVRDGVLIVSSFEGIREELAEAAGELRGKEPSNMERIINSTSVGNGMMGGGMR